MKTNMRYLKGDLLKGDWDVAFHCANPHKVMGSGVAYFLKKKWPEVFQADLKSDSELGTFSKAEVEKGRFVYNLYGQVGVGNDGTTMGRNCQYDHLYNAMYNACVDALKIKDNIRIGVPYKMASDRAGGSWVIVDAMLWDLSELFPVQFIVYQLEDDTEIKSQSSVFIYN